MILSFINKGSNDNRCILRLSSILINIQSGNDFSLE